MCGQVDESFSPILAEYPKLAQKEYKRRHVWNGKRIHWELCCKIWLQCESELVWISARGIVIENDSQRYYEISYFGEIMSLNKEDPISLL